LLGRTKERGNNMSKEVTILTTDNNLSKVLEGGVQ